MEYNNNNYLYKYKKYKEKYKANMQKGGNINNLLLKFFNNQELDFFNNQLLTYDQKANKLLELYKIKLEKHNNNTEELKIECINLLNVLTTIVHSANDDDILFNIYKSAKENYELATYDNDNSYLKYSKQRDKSESSLYKHQHNLRGENYTQQQKNNTQLSHEEYKNNINLKNKYNVEYQTVLKLYNTAKNLYEVVKIMYANKANKKINNAYIENDFEYNNPNYDAWQNFVQNGNVSKLLTHYFT